VDGAALRKRLTSLLVPYLLWSGVIFLGEALQGEVYPPLTYAQRVVLGRVVGPYFYVPLLCQLFLLAPLIVGPAREKWRALLLITAGIQLTLVGLTYVALVGELLGVPGLVGFRKQIPTAFFGRFVFFFSLGVVCGFRLGEVQAWVAEHRRFLILMMFVSAGMAIVESQLAYRLAKMDMGSQVTSIPSTLYALTIMFLLLSTDLFGSQMGKRLAGIGKHSYGIYLLHPVILEIAARSLQEFAPGVLAHQGLFIPFLIIPGLVLPLLFMNLVTRTPLRKHYRYLFG
jgi:membrane-bound acyltransferase YfiQ involved in biofilm formation